jgi:NhaC family Na+:H+ antiporter
MPAPVTFAQAVLPIAFLAVVIVYGLVLRPLAFGQPALPLEVVFPLASAVAVAHVSRLGYAWAEIQDRARRAGSENRASGPRRV